MASDGMDIHPKVKMEHYQQAFAEGKITKRQLNSLCCKLRLDRKAFKRRKSSPSSPSNGDNNNKRATFASVVQQPINIGEKDDAVLPSETIPPINIGETDEAVLPSEAIPPINIGETPINIEEKDDAVLPSEIVSPIHHGEEKVAAPSPADFPIPGEKVISPSVKLPDHIIIQFLLTALAHGVSLDMPLRSVLGAMGHFIPPPQLAPSTTTSNVEVVVPEGGAGGMRMSVDLDVGRTDIVTIPDGLQ
jgi:hypothetical protein